MGGTFVGSAALVALSDGLRLFWSSEVWWAQDFFRCSLEGILIANFDDMPVLYRLVIRNFQIQRLKV